MTESLAEQSRPHGGKYRWVMKKGEKQGIGAGRIGLFHGNMAGPTPHL